MERHPMKRWLITASLLFAAATQAVQAGDILKAFPAAESGMTRHVLTLPTQTDESTRRVELIVGKTLQTDAGNRYFYAGHIEAQNIDGWGFTRYVVAELGPLAGTLMAVDPTAPKVARFIALGGEPYLIRYNSKLPVVVYVPAGVEVRYRIWTAQDPALPISEG